MDPSVGNHIVFSRIHVSQYDMLSLVMKHLFLFIFLFPAACVYGQQPASIARLHNDSANTVSFVTTFNMSTATKDGYYIKGYIVEIDYEQAKKLQGKKIRITGNWFIVKGIVADLTSNKDNQSTLKQGRLKDSKHITTPLITIL
jgi:hypothetical protein